MPISKKYFAKRTLQSIFMVWIVVTFLFFLFRLMPGDFVNIMIYEGADQETIRQFEREWGLDQPLYIQYFEYMTNIITGNAGTSVQYRIPVWDLVNVAIFNSFILVAPAITLGYVLGSTYGVLAGTNRDSILEKYGIIPLFFVGSFPSFFIAIVLVLIFSGWLNLFPTSGIISTEVRHEFSDAPWWRMYFTTNFLWHYTLPFTAIVLRYVFSPALIMRTSVVEVLGQGFIYYSRITGLPKIDRLRRVSRHASLPVITLYPISMTRAIGGLVLVETVFNWSGVGWLLVQAVSARDYPVLMFVFMLVGIFIITANYLVDIIYGIVDPRVQIDS